MTDQVQSPQTKKHQPRMALLAAATSIATVTLLIILKAVAYAYSGSASVLASLIDSISDAGVSLVTFLVIHYSLRPADSNHRHGHGKAEGLAALFQAAFIAAAGLFLFIESLSHLKAPAQAHESFGLVTALMVVATGVSVLLVAVQKYTLDHAPSLAVEADRVHYKSDIVINLGTVGVVLALSAGAPAWIDTLFALFVVIWLGLVAREVGGKGLDMLLDRELPDAVRFAITEKVLAQKNVLGMHDLRTNKSGMKIFISFDIEADPALSLHDAHEITRSVERALLADFPLAEIMIHVDPYGDTEDSRHQVAGVHR